MNDKWWEVEGCTGKNLDTGFRGIIIKPQKLLYFQTEKQWRPLKKINFIPDGVPFDCIPNKAEFIEFDNDGKFGFREDDTEVSHYLPFLKCPEKWKDKEFPITVKLRRLIND